ncbi:MAG TPA: hypothetical protein VH370_07950 [Humisphaera sp.]|jgi:hypothetical protein|nr:hypothetical protein [Humisphaera sp.]
MTTFDFNQVRDFAAGVNAELDQCENGEGAQCRTIDATLSYCAERCGKFIEEVRKWGRDVFAGRVAFDPAAEQLWKAELSQLYLRAINLLTLGNQAEQSCFVLDGKRKLESSLWNVHQLLDGWVTPKLSVGPSARQKVVFTDADRRRIESLPSLPADWTPDDPHQAAQLRRFKEL